MGRPGQGFSLNPQEGDTQMFTGQGPCCRFFPVAPDLGSEVPCFYTEQQTEKNSFIKSSDQTLM